MKNHNKQKGWISIHIFFKGNIYTNDCDTVIVETVKTYIENYKKKNVFEKFFFIRYSEFGAHIRLRLYGELTILKRIGKVSLEQHIEKTFPKKIIALPKVEKVIKNYLWIDYEPEINRYGGNEGIKVAEEFFYYSSLCSLELIEEIQVKDKSNRLGKGLISMIILLFIFFENKKKASVFIQNYGINYIKPFTNNKEQLSEWINIFNDGFDKQSEKMSNYTILIWNALREGIEINSVFDLYKNNLKLIKNKLFDLQMKNLIVRNSQPISNWVSTLNTIIPSYIHMMNNRLGISIQDESYLAHIIYWSLTKNIEITTEQK